MANKTTAGRGTTIHFTDGQELKISGSEKIVFSDT